jgi:hypothetical protein
VIVSFSPGRVRLRFKELKNQAIAEQAYTRIKSIPGIINVEIKALTGSLLIEYDTKIFPAEKLLELGKAELAKLHIPFRW